MIKSAPLKKEMWKHEISRLDLGYNKKFHDPQIVRTPNTYLFRSITMDKEGGSELAVLAKRRERHERAGHHTV